MKLCGFEVGLDQRAGHDRAHFRIVEPAAVGAMEFAVDVVQLDPVPLARRIAALALDHGTLGSGEERPVRAQRLLDRALERSYRDLRGRAYRKRRETLVELRELRIDLARYADELSNTTKFFGDWHLARVYETIASRFHLVDWHRNVDEKLRTLDDLYQIMQHDQSNRWMLILESTIVLLFIIDLILIFMLK